MNKFLLLLICFSLLSSKVISNDSLLLRKAIEKRHFLSISPTFSYTNKLDYQFSPLIYSGMMAGASIAFESDRLKHKWSVKASGFMGEILGETQRVTYPASYSGFNLYANYLHQIGENTAKVSKYLGASFQSSTYNYYNQNLQNAASSYTSVNNISFTASAEKIFYQKAKSIRLWFLKFNQRERFLKLKIGMDLPLVFYNLRPPYSSIRDFTNGENEIDLQSKFYYVFKDAFKLNTTVSMTYYLHNNNAVRMSYLWEVYKFNDTFDSYQSAQHIFEFSLLFCLNKVQN